MWWKPLMAKKIKVSKIKTTFGQKDERIRWRPEKAKKIRLKLEKCEKIRLKPLLAEKI